MEAAWKFVRSGALVIGTIEHAELTQLHGLMSRYWDRPMDFADATLVYLAKRESLCVILTVDQADFATYQIEGKRQFRVLPGKTAVATRSSPQRPLQKNRKGGAPGHPEDRGGAPHLRKTARMCGAPGN
jgi:hypothetical protein